MRILSTIGMILLLFVSMSNAHNVDSLKNILHSQNNLATEEVVKVYYDVAFHYIKVDTQPDSAKKYAEKILNISRSKKYQHGEMMGLATLAKIELWEDNSKTADSIFNLASSLVDVNKNTPEYADFMFSYGGAKLSSSDYDRALKFYKEALSISEQLNDSIIMGKAANNIGIIYDILGESNTSLSYYNRASEIFKRTGQLQFYANAMVNMVVLNSNIKKYDEVRRLFPEALRVCRDVSNYYAAFNLYLNIASVENDEGNLTLALDYLNVARPYLDSLKNNFQINTLFHHWFFENGEIHLAQNNYDKALQNFKSALLYAKQGNYTRFELNSYKYIVECFEAMDRNDSALYYNKRHNELMVKEIEERNSKEIARVEYEFELQKQEEEQKLEAFKLTSRISKLRIIGISFGALLIMGLIVIYVITQNRKRKISESNLIKENLSRQLESKDKELTTNVLYLLKKNEFLEELTKSLQELYGRIIPENKNYVRRIIREVENNTYEDSWEEFEKRFQEVHVDFYKNLSRDYPGLTPNELKICAFLKLNMTSKDISSITNQSVESLKVARYRLRKKLGLAKGENLVAFLAKY